MQNTSDPTPSPTSTPTADTGSPPLTPTADTEAPPSAPRQRPARQWAAVAVVAAATFTVVTAEMLPVGLLTPMAGSLRVSEGAAGLTLTITGLVAALSAPLVPLVAGHFDRRLLLCLLMAVLAIANLVSAWAPHFAVMVVARVLVGLAMGGVWSLAAGLAVRLVPERSVGTATSLIFSGIAIASVLGVPAGTYIGDLGGWRSAFAVTGAVALLVAVAMAVLLPRLPAERGTRAGGVAGLFRNPRITTGLTLVALLVAGHFAAYTYIRPVLEDTAGADATQVGTLLLCYGIAGIAGNFAAGTTAPAAPRATLAVTSALIAASVLLIPVIGGTAAAAAGLLVVWGAAYGGVSVGAQTWLMSSAPEAREAASALFVGVFNGSIAIGALIGGRVVDAAGPPSVMWLGGALAVGALVVTMAGRAPRGRRTPKGR
ncbi:MFS transporter [Nocardiopsis sediminis]|uniref:MFS transporter n=1 Tax=Nocardiopsis sediminis TaxID=1778267 RepID=A0ABV8FRQ0_9ACTN